MSSTRSHRPTIICALALAITLLTCPGAVSAKKRQAKVRRDLSALRGPADDLPKDAGLLDKALSVATVYETARQHHSDVGVKRFKGSVLGYVTPWNRAGYELAVLFRAKLTHVSPVWYTLKRTAADGGGAFVVEGGHEHNATWIDALRQPPPPPQAPEEAAGTSGPLLVVPRFIIELEQEDMFALLTKPAEAAAALLHVVFERGYDGMVLEVWLHWVAIRGMANQDFRDAAYGFIRFLSAKLHAANKVLLLAVPPVLGARYNAPSMDVPHFLDVADAVDGWSVMTYDHSHAGAPGANAPLPWFSRNAEMLLEGAREEAFAAGLSESRHEPSNLLLGLNFYGYDYNLPRQHADAITTDGYLALLARHRPSLDWDDDDAEHSFEYLEVGNSAMHRVYYPTCLSVQTRLETAEALGVGLSIWELGQGLERFFDLL